MIPIIGLPPPNELEILGQEMREYTRKNPCLVPTDGLLPSYGRMVAGKYRVCLNLEAYRGMWHGSVALLYETGSGPVACVGLPEETLLHVAEWPAEEKSIAREILGHVMGPVILGKKQAVYELSALFALHWFTVALASTLQKEVAHG